MGHFNFARWVSLTFLGLEGTNEENFLLRFVFSRVEDPSQLFDVPMRCCMLYLDVNYLGGVLNAIRSERRFHFRNRPERETICLKLSAVVRYCLSE